MEEKNNVIQNIYIESRKRLIASGIKDVISFDDETLLLNTALGKLTVKGQGIKIESFNTETGDLTATGNFHATVYMADSSNEGGFISRIFR